MSAERRIELPDEYSWKELDSIKARFPMPQNWFFKEAVAPGTKAFFISREPIQGDSFTASLAGMRYKTNRPEGFFTTGLSINVFPDFYRRMRRSPAAVAREFMNNSPKELTPESRVSFVRDSAITTLRRFFRSDVPVIMGRKMGPTNYYIEFSANTSTQTLYTMMFETPSDKWENDIEIARMMIENRQLDQSV
ncbi:MAG: hypothetical protein A2687_05965 [Candidatus Levybacteria bacterium RIFCSPHIGHO2_01_FULL_38_26]|nr:MAG: hypothetical protein A2687_05965 [Candidatus Levybacteria bacterium RIFCSPHIGHO2_01_FULL_38_26]